MAIESVDWLADGMVRHLVRCAQTYWAKEKPELEFRGLYEADIMTFLTRIFNGLGFYSWLEQSYPEPVSGKMDLLAENPNGPDWLIEAKLVWGNIDLRLNMKRFHKTGHELLKDFDNLRKRFKEEYERLVIWVVFSKTGEERPRRKGAKTYSFFDAVQAASESPGAKLLARRKVDVETYCNCPKWKFAHLYFWTVEPKAPQGRAR